MKNTLDTIKIIHAAIQIPQMNMCVNCEISDKNILDVIHINVIKEQI